MRLISLVEFGDPGQFRVGEVELALEPCQFRGLPLGQFARRGGAKIVKAAERACAHNQPQQVADTIGEAIKRQNMPTRAATYVPTTAMQVNRPE